MAQPAPNSAPDDHPTVLPLLRVLMADYELWRPAPPDGRPDAQCIRDPDTYALAFDQPNKYPKPGIIH